MSVGFSSRQPQYPVVPAKLDLPLCQTLFQLLQHQRGYLLHILLGQRAEHHHFVHTRQEFRPQELPQRGLRLVLGVVIAGLIKAQGAALPLTACVAGHNDDGILKGNLSALRIGDASLI